MKIELDIPIEEFDYEKLIENLFGDALYLSNRVKDKSALNNYDCEVMLAITKNIYEAIRILEQQERTNSYD